ncbi:signal peptidase II [bacterium]|nr:MAG: signal peptidase II [bacterium]
MKVSNAMRADVSQLFWPVTVAAIVVGADRILKQLTPMLLERGTAWPGEDWPLRIVHVINTGAAFGTLKGQTDLLTIVSALGIILFSYLLFRSQSGTTHRLGLSLALGGATANFIDRASSGEVIDSIKVDYWPAFNLADVALTVGIGLMVWSAMRDHDPEPEREVERLEGRGDR